eukprot:COSAG02_NODE_1170_length_14123_cov_9.614946_9_plen_98_part_00
MVKDKDALDLQIRLGSLNELSQDDRLCSYLSSGTCSYHSSSREEDVRKKCGLCSIHDMSADCSQTQTHDTASEPSASWLSVRVHVELRVEHCRLSSS